MQPKKKKKIGTQGCILLNLEDGPVRDSENRSGLEQGSFLLVQVVFYGSGLNFDSSDQRLKEMMTNQQQTRT